jgi:hypothetical protein
MLFEPLLAVVRVEEHGHYIGWIDIGKGVVLFQLQPSYVKTCYKKGSARLTSSFLKVVQKVVH